MVSYTLLGARAKEAGDLQRLLALMSPLPWNAALIAGDMSMAISATIFKAEIQITGLDRHYYADHSLTIARHPGRVNIMKNHL